MLDQLVKAHFPKNDEMVENADDIVKNIQAGYQNQFGDEADAKLESALASDGYKNLDEYKESLIYSLQYAEFIKKYVKDNYDDIFEDYYIQENPRYISLIKVTMEDVDKPTDEEKEKLEEVKTLLKEGKDFTDLAADYSDDQTSSAKGNLGIVDSTSQLENKYGKEVSKVAFELKENEVSESIKASDGYYFVKCTSTKKDEIKKELQSIDVDSPLLVYDDYIVYFAFKTYDIKYSDDKIKNTIDTIIKDSLKARDESRGGQS